MSKLHKAALAAVAVALMSSTAVVAQGVPQPGADYECARWVHGQQGMSGMGGMGGMSGMGGMR